MSRPSYSKGFFPMPRFLLPALGESAAEAAPLEPAMGPFVDTDIWMRWLCRVREFELLGSVVARIEYYTQDNDGTEYTYVRTYSGDFKTGVIAARSNITPGSGRSARDEGELFITEPGFIDVTGAPFNLFNLIRYSSTDYLDEDYPQELDQVTFTDSGSLAPGWGLGGSNKQIMGGAALGSFLSTDRKYGSGHPGVKHGPGQIINQKTRGNFSCGAGFIFDLELLPPNGLPHIVISARPNFGTFLREAYPDESGEAPEIGTDLAVSIEGIPVEGVRADRLALERNGVNDAAYSVSITNVRIMPKRYWTYGGLYDEDTGLVVPA